MQRLAHPEGEVASAKAAERCGICFCMSSFASASYEEVAKAAPNGLKFAQFYVTRDDAVNRDAIARMEREGFSAIVLTCDSSVVGKLDAFLATRRLRPPASMHLP